MDPQKGDSYGIGFMSVYGLSAFHPIGTSPDECVACVKDGTTLTLTRIPVDLQEKYGIGPQEQVLFEDSGDDTHDTFEFENGRCIMLDEFAKRDIHVYVGTLKQLQEPRRHDTARVLMDA